MAVKSAHRLHFAPGTAASGFASSPADPRSARGVFEMTHVILRLAPVGVLCAAFAVFAAAQQPAGQPQAKQPPAVQPPVSPAPAETIHPVRAKQVLGAKVAIAGEVSIGTVDD